MWHVQGRKIAWRIFMENPKKKKKPLGKSLHRWEDNINTFTAIVDLSWFNNSYLKSPASTLVDLTFQSRTLRSFSLNQLRNLSL